MYPQYARVNIAYILRLHVQLFVSISERTGSGLLLRSTRESEIRILPSRTTVCNINPYLATTFSFLKTPRDTTANCSTSVSSTGPPKFHVKLWKIRNELFRMRIPRIFFHLLHSTLNLNTNRLKKIGKSLTDKYLF